MSRSAHRPPRCPFQNRGSPNYPPNYGIDIPILGSDVDDGAKAQHHKFLPQDSLLEDQPLWIDDLLGDSEMSPKGVFLRRSASDSAAVLEALAEAFTDLDTQVDEEPCGTVEQLQGSTEACSGLEGSCMYGPNSPRHKTELTRPESSMVSALWESIPQSPFQHVGMDLHGGFEVDQCNPRGNAHIAAAEFDPDKASRRNYGQRSRVRKLQYIAELERTVGVYQTLEADLAARVASLFQRRAVLYEENNLLRQRISGLRKEKMIKDGQHQYLKNELKRLKAAMCGHHRKSKSASFFQMGSPDRGTLDDASWQSLDFAKLTLR